MYDNMKYESNLFYHNTINRMKKYDCILGDLDLKKDHLDNCYDCVCFVKIVEEYIKISNPSIKQEELKQKTYKLVQDIQNKITGIHNIYIQTINQLNKKIKETNLLKFNPTTKLIYK